MYPALTCAFMYNEALVRSLPVQALGLTLTPFYFQRKDSEITPVRGAVIWFPN